MLKDYMLGELIFKFLFVIPAIIGFWIVLSYFGGSIFSAIIYEFIGVSKVTYVFYHVYTDFLAVYLAIYFGCMIVPGWRMLISGICLGFVLYSAGAYVRAFAPDQTLGLEPWQETLTLLLYLTGGILPFLRHFFQWLKRRRETEATA